MASHVCLHTAMYAICEIVACALKCTSTIYTRTHIYTFVHTLIALASKCMEPRNENGSAANTRRKLFGANNEWWNERTDWQQRLAFNNTVAMLQYTTIMYARGPCIPVYTLDTIVMRSIDSWQTVHAYVFAPVLTVWNRGADIPLYTNVRPPFLVFKCKHGVFHVRSCNVHSFYP